MAQPLKLESHLVFDILGDADFYAANPIFLFLEAEGLAANKKFQSIKYKELQKCPKCTKNSLLKVLSRFTQVIKRATEIVPDEAERFAAYLTKRLGYRPSRILLYYNDPQRQLQEIQIGQEHGGSHAQSLHPPETLRPVASVGTQQG